MFKYKGKRLKIAYEREPFRNIQEWAEQEVIFTSRDVSPILGHFNTKYSPHLNKLFALMDRNQTKEFYGKWASQSAKSLFMMLCLGYFLDTYAGTIIYAQPAKEDIPKILQTKVNPVLKSIPKLWKKFEDYKDTEKIRTKDAVKKLAGGNLIVSGSTVKERKSQTARTIFLDEVGEFPEGAVFEFKERTKIFSKFDSKTVCVSTIVHPRDEICTYFKTASVKIEWHFICMECKKNFYPDIKLFKFKTKQEYALENNINKDEIILNKYLDVAKATAHIECPHCQAKIDTVQKDKMLFDGWMDWFIKREDGTYELFEVGKLTTEATFGADMNSFGSYFVRLEDIVENIVQAGYDEAKLDKLHRGWFNRFYKKEIKTLETNDLLLLGNGLSKWKIPEDTIKIYMGVDTQKDHFWYEVKAYTYGNKSHSVAHGRLETFEDIERIWEIGQELVSEHGEVLRISKLGIDRRGYNQDGVNRTKQVDEWVRKMIKKYKVGDENRIYPTEGEPKITGDLPYRVITRKDDSDSYVKVDIKVLKLSNLYLKTAIRGAMQNTINFKKAQTEEQKAEFEDMPMFFVNQTTIEADTKGTTSISYTRQISAEVYDYGYDKSGKKKNEKEFINPTNTDNHYFDTSVICEGFAQQDQVYMMKKPIKEDLSQVLKGLGNLTGN